MRSLRAKAFTPIKFLAVVSIISLLVAIIIPSLCRARELARRAATQSNAENGKLVAAQETAQEVAEELEIDSRVKAIIDHSRTRRVEAAVFANQPEGTEATVETTVFVDQPEGIETTDETRRRRIELSTKFEQNSDEVVSVKIGGKEVYRSAQGKVLVYRGLGEWEDALDRVQWQQNEATKKRLRLEREACEYNFKAERERRFGPLQ